MKYEKKLINKKTCERFGERKPLNKFRADRKREDNHCKICNKCRNKISEKYKKWAYYTLHNHRTAKHFIEISQSELEQMAELTVYCSLCGCKLDWRSKSWIQPNTPSLDRINNEKIINKNNVWIVCVRCNRSKGAMPLPEFIGYCEHIYKRYNKIWA